MTMDKYGAALAAGPTATRGGGAGGVAKEAGSEEKLAGLRRVMRDMYGQDRQVERSLERAENAEQTAEQLRQEVRALRRVNGALLRAKERAEESERRRTELIVKVSHELRSPLNAVLGFADVIDGQVYGEIGHPKYREYGRDLKATATHLLGVVNDILDLAKVEAGAMQFTECWVGIAALLNDCRRMFHELATQRGIELLLDAEADIGGLYCDPLRVRQILVNLLSNAVKFTPSGGRVTVRARKDVEGGLTLQVLDTGVGIPEEQLSVIADPFVQGKRSSDDVPGSQSGTGLGLALARQLAEMHDATLGIESTTRVGTRVTVRFPPLRVGTQARPAKTE